MRPLLEESADNALPISFTGTFINQREQPMLKEPKTKKKKKTKKKQTASKSNKVNELACFKVLAESCGLAANIWPFCTGRGFPRTVLK